MLEFVSNKALALVLVLVNWNITGLFGTTIYHHNQAENTSWELGPFVKLNVINPVLLPLNTTKFYCPVRNESVFWEIKDVFNPTALVKDGKLHLLYRAEDDVGSELGTSRIGLATSNDGIYFERQNKPIFYPDNDDALIYEWEGGCEDPRIIENENGTYYMTYTSYDGKTARLLIASTNNLQSWKKYGSIFKNYNNGTLINLWSKSGSIICKHINDKFIATKINGKYWMYFGDTNIYLAWSLDLINWIPLIDEENGVGDYKLKIIFGPRKGYFDSDLVEPGPQAFLTKHGILLIYNSRNKAFVNGGDPKLPEGTYTAAQILFDSNDPSNILQRSNNYFIKPEKDYEIIGQVNNVVFLEGLVSFKGQWFLYYGTADSKIAVAVADFILE